MYLHINHGGSPQSSKLFNDGSESVCVQSSSLQTAESGENGRGDYPTNQSFINEIT